MIPRTELGFVEGVMAQYLRLNERVDDRLHTEPGQLALWRTVCEIIYHTDTVLRTLRAPHALRRQTVLDVLSMTFGEDAGLRGNYESEFVKAQHLLRASEPLDVPVPAELWPISLPLDAVAPPGDDVEVTAGGVAYRRVGGNWSQVDTPPDGV